jgi:hypothetical protein
MNQDEFSQQLEAAYKSALEGADAIRELAEKDRQAAALELAAAADFRLKTEHQAEEILENYLSDKRKQLDDFTRRELLRQLIDKHLHAGKTAQDISEWLDVSPEFVEEIAIIQRRIRTHAIAQRQVESAALGNAKLTYHSVGRGGHITFTNNQTSFRLWWEFAGGNALLIIGLPSIDDWQGKTGLPLTDMDPVIQFIAEQVIHDHASGRGFFSLGDDYITIYAL